MDKLKAASKTFRRVALRLHNKIKIKNTIAVAIISQIFLIFLTFCTVYVMFGIQKFEDYPTFVYCWNNKIIFLKTALIIFIPCEIIYLFTLVLYAPISVYLIVTICAIVNAVKIELRSEPLVFTDLLLLRESTNIAGEFDVEIGKYLSFAVPIFILILIVPLFIARLKAGYLPRIISAVASLTLTAGFLFTIIIPKSTFIDEGLTNAIWDLSYEYRNNGFVLGFLTSYKRSFVEVPANYSKESTQEYASILNYKDSGAELSVDLESAPNIIAVMNESYWDSRNLTGLTFNKDPMESVRELWESIGGIYMLSAQYGGGTSNVEYEFLTGKSVSFYPPNSNIYQQFISQKQWSLGWYFKELGYSTTAIHPYYDWYWRRRTVYPLIGFENLYFDKDMVHTDRKAGYISDSSLSKEIIERYNQFSENGAKPNFIFAVSMQNHGGYYANKYSEEEREIEVYHSPDDKDVLETFFEGVRYASEAYVELIEYFKDIERPTYILMFGDHAPHFAEYKWLYALNAETELYMQDKLNMYRTPILLWSNVKDIQIQGTETLSPFMLMDELLSQAGLPKPDYISLLAEVRKSTSGFTSMYILDANGSLITDEDRKNYIEDKILTPLRYLQYDATFGSHYVVDELKRLR